MKLLILLCFLLFGATASFAQNEKVKVTLKDGTAITGEMKRIDVSASLTISVAGVETDIPMSNVATIEQVSNAPAAPAPSVSLSPAENASYNVTSSRVLASEQYGEYVITDDDEYPDSFVVTVNDHDFTMVLVRGGTFNMGYDGSGSLKMDSEPVHQVNLSSFYISRNYIPSNLATVLLSGKLNKEKPQVYVSYEENQKKKDKALYRAWIWGDAKNVVDAIAEQQDLPYRLPTEAEWEYSAVTPYAETVFSEILVSKSYLRKEYIGEWCSDIWNEYSPHTQTNPKGASQGNRHVIRAFFPDKRIWGHNLRRHDFNGGNYVRIVISASEIKDKIKG